MGFSASAVQRLKPETELVSEGEGLRLAPPPFEGIWGGGMCVQSPVLTELTIQ